MLRFAASAARRSLASATRLSTTNGSLCGASVQPESFVKAPPLCQTNSNIPSEGFLFSRGKSTTKEGKAGEADSTEDKPQAPGNEGAAEEASGGESAGEKGASVEELKHLLSEKTEACTQLEAQLAETKDKLMYTLADMENLRQRTARQTEEAKKFAVQGFVKSILDVADNLERAAKAVPEDIVHEGKASKLDADSARKMLISMLEGVQLTEKILLQIFQHNGIDKIDPLGEKFDPNLHQALFEMPDPSRDPGTVGAVIKVVLNERLNL